MDPMALRKRNNTLGRYTVVNIHAPFDGMEPDLRRQLTRFTKIFIIASAVFYTAFYLSGIDSEVGTLYFRYAEHMASGEMPYSGFDAEYPPFAMLIIFLPRLISFSSFTYQIAFGLEAYLFLLAGVYYTYRIAERHTDRPSRYTDLFIICTVILLDFVLDRYDVFPMVMLLGSVYYFTERRYRASWIMLALGTVTKLYPAIAAPLLLISLIRRGERSEAVKGVAACLLIGCLCMLPFLIADSGTMLMFLTYHMDRGLQTEAPVSSFIMLLGTLGLTDVSYIFNYGSDNISGALPDMVAGWMMPLMVVCMLSVYVAYIIASRRRTDDETLIMCVFTTVMVFMLVNKVLSSQYLVWIIPFVVIMVMIADDRKPLHIFYAAVALTQSNLVVNYAFRDAGEPFTIPGILILVMRNVLMLALMYLVCRGISLERESPDGEL